MPDVTPSAVDYAQLLAQVKERIRCAQYAALKAVNTELVGLYWDLGRMIVERQEQSGWGKSVVERLSQDLRKEFPGVAGFSVQNLWYMRQFHMEYREHEKLQPLVGEIGVATYEITRTLPKELKGQLPRPEEIAALLEGLDP